MGVEDFSSSDGVGETAEDKAGGELVVRDPLHLRFDIFSRSNSSHLNVVGPNLFNFDLPLECQAVTSLLPHGDYYFVGHDQQGLSLLAAAALHLAYDDGAHVVISDNEQRY